MWALIIDSVSVAGKLVTTGLIVACAVCFAVLAGRLSARRVDDRYRKYYARKIAHYVVAVVATIGIGILWRPFAGQLGLVIGLTTAGLAFARNRFHGRLCEKRLRV